MTVGGCGGGGEFLYTGVDNMPDIFCDREGPAAEVGTAETVCTGWEIDWGTVTDTSVIKKQQNHR